MNLLSDREMGLFLPLHPSSNHTQSTKQTRCRHKELWGRLFTTRTYSRCRMRNSRLPESLQNKVSLSWANTPSSPFLTTRLKIFLQAPHRVTTQSSASINSSQMRLTLTRWWWIDPTVAVTYRWTSLASLTSKSSKWCNKLCIARLKTSLDRSIWRVHQWSQGLRIKTWEPTRL